MKSVISTITFFMVICASAQWTVVNLSENAGYSAASAIAHSQTVGQSDGHAVYWEVPSGKKIDLHPSGYISSQSIGVFGAMQVGSAQTATFNANAGMWMGTAASFISLHPAGHENSFAFGTNGSIQVGWAGSFGAERACKWGGSAATWVDIHPVGYAQSVARSCEGTQIVGYANSSGSPRAVVFEPQFAELHPPGSVASYATGVNGVQQVGGVIVDGDPHAALWQGTPQSWVDLHEAGWDYSEALAVYQGCQVGLVGIDGSNATQASLWFGTGGSRIDLHQYCAGFWRTRATGVWIDGERTYVSGHGNEETLNRNEALLWISLAVAPTSYSMFRGSVFSGNLASLLSSDNDRLVMRPGVTLGTSQPPIQIILNATAPTASPNGFSFSVESSASFGNSQQKISLYNFNTGLYEELDARLAKTTDDTVTVTVRTNPSRFIEPGTLAMRALVSFRAVGPSLAFPWSGRIDKAWWSFPG